MLPRELLPRLLAALPERERAETERLLQYAPDTAGGLMTTEFVASRTFEAALDLGGRPVESATFDPLRLFPDRSPADNVWPRPQSR